MKIFTVIVLALLLFVVAFAGLSPPTKHNKTLAAVASHSPIESNPTVTADNVALNSIQKINIANASDTTGATPTTREVSVNPVARNGENHSAARYNPILFNQSARNDADIVLSLRL